VVLHKGRSRRATLQTLRAQLRHVHAKVGGALTIQTGRWRAKPTTSSNSGWSHDMLGGSPPVDTEWDASPAAETAP